MTSLSASGVRRLNALLRQAREPVFVLDPEFRLVYVNPAWEILTGCSADSVLKGEDEGLASSEVLQSFMPPPEVRDGHPGGGVSQIRLAHGERVRRRIEFWPYHGDDGELLGLVGLVRPSDSAAHAPESESQRLRGELLDLREQCRNRLGLPDLIGKGPRHDRLLSQIANASLGRGPVLVVGESGTGRTLVARTIHHLSAGSDLLPVTWDVSALSAEVLHRELLFRAERAESEPNTTILVDDVLDLSRDLQERLASLSLAGQTRILAISRHDPEGGVRDERLRGDLYFALTSFVIRLPPLRERLDEIAILAHHFLELANRAGGRPKLGFHRDALAILQEYDWPGNLSELARVVAAARVNGTGDVILAEDLPADVRNHDASYCPPAIPETLTPLDDWLALVERKLIEQALFRARQNKSKAAELLGISRPRLYRRIKDLNVPDEPEPPESSGF